MNDRDITMRVRSGLDALSAIEAGRDPNERRPLAEIFAEKIPGELIPGLLDLYLTMLGMAAQWQQKEFQQALKIAFEKGTPLAGFNAEVWLGWGGLLLALLAFLDTPQESLGGITAKDALLADYIKGAAIVPTETE